MVFEMFHQCPVSLVFDKEDYRNFGVPTVHAKGPSKLGHLAKRAPPLSTDQRLVHLDGPRKFQIWEYVFLHELGERFTDQVEVVGAHGGLSNQAGAATRMVALLEQFDDVVKSFDHDALKGA